MTTGDDREYQSFLDYEREQDDWESQNDAIFGSCDNCHVNLTPEEASDNSGLCDQCHFNAYGG